MSTQVIPIKKRKSFRDLLTGVTTSSEKVNITLDRANMARRASQSRKPSQNNIFFQEMPEGTSVTIPAEGRATIANSIRKLGYTVTTRMVDTAEGKKLTAVLLAKFLVNRKSRAVLEKKYLEMDLPAYQAWVAELKQQHGTVATEPETATAAL